jgi:hypothetical protein
MVSLKHAELTMGWTSAALMRDTATTSIWRASSSKPKIDHGVCTTLGRDCRSRTSSSSFVVPRHSSSSELWRWRLQPRFLGKAFDIFSVSLQLFFFNDYAGGKTLTMARLCKKNDTGFSFFCAGFFKKRLTKKKTKESKKLCNYFFSVKK